jgi:hypothetical protein
MLPRDFWAGAAGDLLTLIFGAVLALLLAPLSGLTTGLQNFFAQFMPQ